jgi:hypothetical protein
VRGSDVGVLHFVVILPCHVDLHNEFFMGEGEVGDLHFVVHSSSTFQICLTFIVLLWGNEGIVEAKQRVFIVEQAWSLQCLGALPKSYHFMA